MNALKENKSCIENKSWVRLKCTMIMEIANIHLQTLPRCEVIIPWKYLDKNKFAIFSCISSFAKKENKI